MSELDLLLTELYAHNRAMTDVLESIRKMLSAEDVEGAREAVAEKKTFTLEEVRAILLEKRKAGFRDEIKALLLRHGADRLTEIDPAEYSAMMEEAEDIGK